MRLPATLLAFCFQTLFIPLSAADSDYGKRDLLRLSAKELNTLATYPDPSSHLNLKSSSSHLSKILIPRAPDTTNNTFVRNYIANTLRQLDWDVEEDSFEGDTPYGRKRFTNVIATKDPSAPSRLVLAAHFDSKFFPTFPENQFVGATDSAAPCAMLLDLAEALNPLLDRRAAQLLDGDRDDEDTSLHTTLQIIFFDGEEAYKDWTSTDSIYGAKHLADRWEGEYLSPHPKRRQSPHATSLSTIEHMVLLDLLGAVNPKIPSYYPPTQWLHEELVSIEGRLDKAGLSGRGGRDLSSFFYPSNAGRFGHIEDDHIPFLQRGINILHIIPTPFPRVWHTLKDDASALDLPTMKKWNLIFRVFTAEYLGLQPDVKGAAKNIRKISGELIPKATCERHIDEVPIS